MSESYDLSVEAVEALFPNAKKTGAATGALSGIASLDEAEPGDLSFLGNTKYKKQVKDTHASVVLLPEDFEAEPGSGQLFIFVPNPSLALAQICQRIEQSLWMKRPPSIHPSAYIDGSARVAPSAYVGPMCVVEEGAEVGAGVVLQSHAYVGQNAVVGESSYLMPHASVLGYCKLGKRTRLHSGVVVGSDGFGYEFVDGQHKKVPQIGIVRVGDDVEIGSNTTIDRARFGETVIDDGTKIDNLVQIGHNVKIGKHCVIVSLSGVSGSVIIEDYVVVGGQVGMVGHIRIGKGSKIGGQTGLNHDLEPGSFVRGAPAFPYMLAHRIDALKRHIPDLFKRVKKIEEELASTLSKEAS